jgi:hypothetical protein
MCCRSTRAARLPVLAIVVRWAVRSIARLGLRWVAHSGRNHEGLPPSSRIPYRSPHAFRTARQPALQVPALSAQALPVGGEDRLGQQVVEPGEQLSSTVEGGAADLCRQSALLSQEDGGRLEVVELAAGDVVLAEVALYLPDDARVVGVEVAQGDLLGQLALVGQVDQLEVEAAVEEVLDVGVGGAGEFADLDQAASWPLPRRCLTAPTSLVLESIRTATCSLFAPSRVTNVDSLPEPPIGVLIHRGSSPG